MPPKKRTEKQSAYRNVFGQVQRAWKTLTVEQQQSFKDSADMFPVRNRLGDLVHLSGYNWFIRTNLLLLSVDLDLLRETNNNVSGSVSYDQWTEQYAQLTGSGATQALSIRFDARVSETALVGNRYIAYVSAPVSAGITAFHGNWIVAGFGLVPSSTTVGAIHTYQINRYTSFLPHNYRVGDYVFVRFLVMAPQNGATYQDEYFRVQLT